MSVLMDPLSSNTDPQTQVKELQDLVRKLQHEKQELLSKTQTSSKPTLESLHKTQVYGSLSKARTFAPSTDSNDNIADTSLDDIGDLNFEALDVSDDESWLYSSPQSMSPTERSLSPFKWLRRDVDNPENIELQLSKKALINRLDSLKGSPKKHSPSSSSVDYSMSISSQSSSPGHVPSQTARMPVLKTTPPGQRVDTRTFIRPKKKKSSPPQVPVDFDGYRAETVRTHYASPSDRWFDRTSSSERLDDDRLSTASDSSFSHQLQDVEDVQNVARLQEETLGSPHSSQSLGSPILEDQENHGYHSEGSSGDPNQLQSHGSSVDGSTSPPDSPYSSQSLEQPSSHSSSLRRSLPNLSHKLPNGVPSRLPAPGSGHSPEKLRHHAGSDSRLQKIPHRTLPQPQIKTTLRPQSGISRPLRLGGARQGYPGSTEPHIPQIRSQGSNARMQQPSRVRQNGVPSMKRPATGRYESPTRPGSGIPTYNRTSSPGRPSNATSIPRPSSSRQSAQSSRGGAVGLGRRYQQRTRADDWKDGCY